MNETTTLDPPVEQAAPVHNWNPDYDFIVKKRAVRNEFLEYMDFDEISYFYKDDPVRFIVHFGITYDPRRELEDGNNFGALIPFVLFKRQKEFILWLDKRLKRQKDGTVWKSRDMGATWCCVAFSVWMWIFKKGSAVGWGSSKEILVDRLGDPGSIFEKIRMQIEALPPSLLPIGYNEKLHSSYMKIINPDNGANITGAAGDNIGRGDRKTIFFKDESAWYDRPEKIEAALSATSKVKIDISSINGVGNPFYNKTQSKSTNLFIMDWMDHPHKTQEWHDKEEAKWADMGLLHIFRQEVDRDPTAGIDRILIPGEYVRAAVDAHLKLNVEIVGIKQSGFDPFDEGGDRHALVKRHGILVTYYEEWGYGGTGEGTKKVYTFCADNGIEKLIYDAIGLGVAVRTTLETLTENAKENGSDYKLDYEGYVAGAKVEDPEMRVYGDRKNKDMFFRLNAQQGWRLRERFLNTYNAVVHGEPFDPENIISIDSKIPDLHKLLAQISQPIRGTNNAGQMIIEKKPNGSKSPNGFDALNMAFYGRPLNIPETGLYL